MDLRQAGGRVGVVGCIPLPCLISFSHAWISVADVGKGVRMAAGGSLIRAYAEGRRLGGVPPQCGPLPCSSSQLALGVRQHALEVRGHDVHGDPLSRSGQAAGDRLEPPFPLLVGFLFRRFADPSGELLY
jgi:hypothetical protein